MVQIAPSPQLSNYEMPHARKVNTTQLSPKGHGNNTTTFDSIVHDSGRSPQGVSFTYEQQQSPNKNNYVGLKSNLKQSSIMLDEERQKNSVNPKHLRLIQRLILKYSSKFGTSDEVVTIIEKTVGRNLDGKSQVNPQLFDDIEREIDSQIQKLDSTFAYTPKLRAMKGVKQP